MYLAIRKVKEDMPIKFFEGAQLLVLRCRQLWKRALAFMELFEKSRKFLQLMKVQLSRFEYIGKVLTKGLRRHFVHPAWLGLLAS